MSPAELRARLIDAFRWRGDRTDRFPLADLTGWWRSASVLAALGPALAAPFRDLGPTEVIGPQSRGCLLGPLVALSLGVDFVEIRKDPERGWDSQRLWEQTMPSDYEDKQLRMGFPRWLVGGDDRVVLVDDWIATGAQASTCHQLVLAAGATWLGTSVIVDSLERPELRRTLQLTSLLHHYDL